MVVYQIWRYIPLKFGRIDKLLYICVNILYMENILLRIKPKDRNISQIHDIYLKCSERYSKRNDELISYVYNTILSIYKNIEPNKKYKIYFYNKNDSYPQFNRIQFYEFEFHNLIEIRDDKIGMILQQDLKIGNDLDERVRTNYYRFKSFLNKILWERVIKELNEKYNYKKLTPNNPLIVKISDKKYIFESELLRINPNYYKFKLIGEYINDIIEL